MELKNNCADCIYQPNDCDIGDACDIRHRLDKFGIDNPEIDPSELGLTIECPFFEKYCHD